MKLLRSLFFIPIILLLIYVVGGIYLSNERTINRTIVINAQESDLKKNINNLPEFNKFGDMSTSSSSSRSYYTIIAQDTGCRVTLSMEINAVDDTYHKWIGWFAAQIVGKDFEKGLRSLKETAEAEVKENEELRKKGEGFN